MTISTCLSLETIVLALEEISFHKEDDEKDSSKSTRSHWHSEVDIISYRSTRVQGAGVVDILCDGAFDDDLRVLDGAIRVPFISMAVNEILGPLCPIK